jgi:hypothetical protein
MAMGEPMDRSKRVFGHLAPFEEVFPTIESATISSYEDGEGVYTFGVDESRRRTFGKGVPFREGLIPCRNPRCRRGGYEIDHSLSEMVRENVTEKEFDTACPGDEGSPKGRRPGRSCGNVLHYRLTIKYKSEGLPAS